MIKYLCITLVLLVVALTGFTMGQGNKKEMEGDKPYVPTRLEWLALECIASNGVSRQDSMDFSLSFFPAHNEDTIVIWVNYYSNVNRENMNRYIELARNVIKSKKKQRGWDWLRIEEEVTMIGQQY